VASVAINRYDAAELPAYHWLLRIARNTVIRCYRQTAR
jgi:DNA-directed RNA polymerase specialized sigma24 family protein